MESVQKQIAKYIDNKGITIMHISQKTGITYELLRLSLNANRKKTSTQQRLCAWRKINIEFHRIYGVQTIRYRIAGRYCHLVNWIIFRLELLNGRIKYWIIEWFNYILYLWKWWILCWIKWFRHCCYSWKSDFIVFNRRHPICYSEKSWLCHFCITLIVAYEFRLCLQPVGKVAPCPVVTPPRSGFGSALSIFITF